MMEDTLLVPLDGQIISVPVGFGEVVSQHGPRDFSLIESLSVKIFKSLLEPPLPVIRECILVALVKKPLRDQDLLPVPDPSVVPLPGQKGLEQRREVIEIRFLFLVRRVFHQIEGQMLQYAFERTRIPFFVVDDSGGFEGVRKLPGHVRVIRQ